MELFATLAHFQILSSATFEQFFEVCFLNLAASPLKYHLGHLAESVVYVHFLSSGGFEVLHAVLLGQSFRSVGSHLSFVLEVALVADEDLAYVLLGVTSEPDLLVDLYEPTLDCLE